MNFLENCRFCLNYVDSSDRTTINNDIRRQFKDVTCSELRRSGSDFSNFSCSNCLSSLESCIIIKRTFLENQKFLLDQHYAVKNSNPDNSNFGEFNLNPEVSIEVEEEDSNYPTNGMAENEQLSDTEHDPFESVTFIQDFTADVHPKTHEQLIPCQICGRRLKKESLRMHMRRAHSDKRIVCDVCNRGFHFKNVLLNHLKGHFKIKDVSCPQCSQKFSTRNAMLSHQKVNHRFVKKETYLAVTITTCEFCGKVCPNKAEYENHLRVEHAGEKPFKCDFDNCDKSYLRARDLSIHKKTAHSEPVACPVCNKKVSNLSKHKKIHKSYDFQCTFVERGVKCKKAYRTNDRLKRHLDTSHRGIKKCFCTQYPPCNASYFKSENLADHIRVVHQKIRIKCELCPALLTRKDYYKKHILTYHKDLDAMTKQEILDNIKNIERLYTTQY